MLVLHDLGPFKVREWLMSGQMTIIIIPEDEVEM